MSYFKDPTVPDKNKRKKAHYWEDSDKHINFLSKLRVDGLNQSQFHRAMIDGYLNDDPELLAYLERYKKKCTVQGERKRAIVNRMKRQTQTIKKQFALDSGEVETIFDIIEPETSL